MKKFRKLTAVITALCLAGSMMATMSMLNVSAEGETYSITITQNQDNATHVYEAYQVFSGDYADGVLSNIKWGDGVKQSITDTSTTTNLIDVVKAINVGTAESEDKPFATCTSASEVAGVLGDLQTAINEAANETATATATARKETVLKAFANAIAPFLNDDNKVRGGENTGKVAYTIDVSTKGAGYYLVQDGNSTTNTGQMDGSKTRYILEVIGDTNASAIAKNSSPSVIKKVKENTKSVDGYDTNTITSGSIEAQVNTDNGTITNGGWNDVADYNIGDTVPFKLYGSMPSTLDDYAHYYYEFQDTLGTQFTVVDGDDADNKVDVVVKVNDTVVNSSGYTIEDPDTDNGETCTFKVVINDVKNLTDESSNKITVTKDSIITVEYQATLNSNAVIGLNGQENKVKLVYSNNPNNTGDGTKKPDETGDTPEDKVIVFTYELDITKVDGAAWEAYINDTSETKGDFKDYGEYTEHYLANAEFTLYTGKDESGNGTGEVAVYTKTTTSTDSEGNTVKTVEYYKEKGEDTTDVTWSDTTTTTLKTGEDGKIRIVGLDDGTYYLEETKAPAGYNALTDLIKLQVKATTVNDQDWNNTTAETASDALTKLELFKDNETSASDTNTINRDMVNAIISNNKGSSLPSTGGIGTTIFYMVGGVLVVGAGVTLIAKKRMKNNEQ